MIPEKLKADIITGNFESRFKDCKSTEDKVKLFSLYGVSVSLEQYREIENKVAVVKEGKLSSEDSLDKVSAGRRDPNEKAVFDVLAALPINGLFPGLLPK